MHYGYVTIRPAICVKLIPEPDPPWYTALLWDVQRELADIWGPAFMVAVGWTLMTLPLWLR